MPELRNSDFDEFSSPQESIFGDVVDRTVNNGFLGRLDIGKRLIGSENRSFSAGFIVSDKVMIGTDLVFRAACGCTHKGRCRLYFQKIIKPPTRGSLVPPTGLFSEF